MALSFGEPPVVSRSTTTDRKSTRLNSSHANISYAVFCLKTIRDDGRVIPENKLDEDFSRFHQIDSADALKKGGLDLKSTRLYSRHTNDPYTVVSSDKINL